MKIKKFYYAWLLLFLLSLIWGSSPILIKKALISLNPFEIGALRLSFAALVLLPFLAKSLRDLKKNDFLILFISGIVGNVIPYFLYPIAQTKIDSATSGVLTSLTPFFALIIGVVFYRQKATKNNLIGLIIGFIGTATLILFTSKTSGNGPDIFGLFVVLATVLYGINLNLIKYHLNHLKPITITSFSIVLILPITLYILIVDTPFLEHFNDFADTYVKDAGKGYPEVVDGYFYPPDKPGWGIEIDEDYIEKYPPNLSSAGIIADPGLNMFENNNWAKRGQD